MGRTTVEEPLKVGHYSGEYAGSHEDEGIGIVSYSGPGLKFTGVRTWNRYDETTILQALHSAYMQGQKDAQRAIREALGCKEK